MFDLHIKNGVIVTSEQVFRGDVYVSGQQVAQLGNGQEDLPARQVIDAAGNYVLPGFVDPHSHLNDPGLTESEDFYTGTCSAAAGGITTVLEHPLTFPLPASRQPFVEKRSIAAKKCVVDYCLFGACSPDNYKDIEAMLEEGAVAFKAFMPYSVEIPQLNDGQLLAHLSNLRGRGAVLTVHCENDAIINQRTAALTAAGRVACADYPQGRPAIAEIEAVNRLCLLTEASGGRSHVAHCSTAAGVEAVAAFKERQVDITVETCVHYLYFNADDLQRLGVFGVCNPPFRSPEEPEKLWRLIRQGKVDFIGSDHAAYTVEEKQAGRGDAFKTPAGFTGIQTCFPFFFDQGVNKRKLDIRQFVAMSSANAAKRYGIFPQKGAVAIGSDADLVIFAPHSGYRVTPESLFYKVKETPFLGMSIEGRVLSTIVRGRLVYDGEKILAQPGYGRFVRPRWQ